MRVLIVDNYDSFTYNLAQYLGELGAEPIVYRNDALPPCDAGKVHPTHLLISPGPGRPEDAGYSMEYLTTLGTQMPTLGVCLGLQAAVVAFGGAVGHAPRPRHGIKKGQAHKERERGAFNYRPLNRTSTACCHHSLRA